MLIRYFQSCNFKHHAKKALVQHLQNRHFHIKQGRILRQPTPQVSWLSVVSRGHMGAGGTVGGVDTVQGEELQGSKQVTGADMVKSLTAYIWPKGDSNEDRDIKRRVMTALGLMVGSKVINTSVPFIFSSAVDSLGSPETVIPGVVMGTLACYGVARATALGCAELRNAVFAKVAQHSIRRIAQNVFRHLHNLDLRYHELFFYHNIYCIQHNQRPLIILFFQLSSQPADRSIIQDHRQRVKRYQFCVVSPSVQRGAHHAGAEYCMWCAGLHMWSCLCSCGLLHCGHVQHVYPGLH